MEKNRFLGKSGNEILQTVPYIYNTISCPRNDTAKTIKES